MTTDLAMIETAVAVPMMTEMEARSCLEIIARNVEQTRTLVLDFKEREGWRALGYQSWRECAAKEIGQSFATVYRELKAAEVDRNISHVEKTPLPTTQALQLARLEAPAAQAEVLTEVKERKGDEPVTAADLKDAVDERLGVAPTLAPSRHAPSREFADDFDESTVNQDGPAETEVGICGLCGEPLTPEHTCDEQPADNSPAPRPAAPSAWGAPAPSARSDWKPAREPVSGPVMPRRGGMWVDADPDSVVNFADSQLSIEEVREVITKLATVVMEKTARLARAAG